MDSHRMHTESILANTILGAWWLDGVVAFAGR